MRRINCQVIIIYFHVEAKFWQQQISRWLQGGNNHDTMVDRTGHRLISTTNTEAYPMMLYMQKMWCNSAEKQSSASTVNFFSDRPVAWGDFASHAQIFTLHAGPRSNKTTVTTMTTKPTTSLSLIKFTLAVMIQIQLTAWEEFKCY